MKTEKFTKYSFNNLELNKVQQNIEKYTNQFINNPFLKGFLIENIEISTTPISLSHGLGVVPQGFFVVDNNSNAVIWRVSSTDKVIELQADNSATIKVWVF